MAAIPGLSFARLAQAMAISRGSIPDARAFAEARWGAASPPSLILRVAVSPGQMTDATWAEPLSQYNIAGGEFVEMLRPRTVLGKLLGVRRAPPRSKVPRATSGTSGSWTGELEPVRVTSMALDMLTVEWTEIAAICVATIELAKMSDPSAETTIRNDLLAAAVQATDTQFVSTAAAIVGVRPAGVAWNAQTIASTGSTAAAIVSDFRRLLNVLADTGSTFKAPYFVMSPQTAIGLATMRGSTGDAPFPDMTPAGGTMFGVPVLTSSAVDTSISSVDSPPDSPPVYTSAVLAIDAGELIVAEPNFAMIDVTYNANVQMDSGPDSPLSASTTSVSFWQHNLVGWRIVRPCYWTMARDCVAVLSGVQY